MKRRRNATNHARIVLCVALSIALWHQSASARSLLRKAPPIMITRVQTTPVVQASTAIATTFDSTLGTLFYLHVVWMQDDRIYYRKGRFNALSPDSLVGGGTFPASDPVLTLKPNTLPALVWAEEGLADGRRVPGEWNLRYTPDPLIPPRWLTEDLGAIRLQPDRHPVLTALGDSMLFLWERGSPSQIVASLLTPQNPFPPVIPLTDNAYPSIRPRMAASPTGEVWAIWTAEAPTGREVWTATSFNGVFSRMRRLRAGCDDHAPAMAFDSEGRPHLVWQDGMDGGAIYYARGNRSGEFGPSLRATPPGLNVQHPSILLDADDIPHITWQNLETAAVEQTMILFTQPLTPIGFIENTYQPRFGEVWPRLFRSPFGEFVTTFIAPDRVTDTPNIWMSIEKQESGDAAVSGLSAGVAETPAPEGATIRSAIVAMGTPAHSLRGPRLRATPNPFNGSTIVTVEIVRPAEIRAEIYTITGQRVAVLADDRFPSGLHRFAWNGRDEGGRRLGSGTYHLRIRLRDDDGGALTRTMPLSLLR